MHGLYAISMECALRLCARHAIDERIKYLFLAQWCQLCISQRIPTFCCSRHSVKQNEGDTPSDRVDSILVKLFYSLRMCRVFYFFNC